MLNPTDIDACTQEDWEVVDQCEGPNPTPPDDDDDNELPPGGGDPNSPPLPGPGPFGPGDPCDPGPPPAGFTPIGPMISVASPGPRTKRVIRHFPYSLAGAGSSGLGPGAPIALPSDTGNFFYTDIPCFPNINDPFACSSAYTAKGERTGSNGRWWVSVGGPYEAGSQTPIDVSWRAEDYDIDTGQLISAWVVECSWVSPNYPLLTILHGTALQNDCDGVFGFNTTISSNYDVYWSTSSPVFPPGSTTHRIVIEWSGDPLFGSMDGFIDLLIGQTQPTVVAGVGAGVGGKCVGHRISGSSSLAPRYFRARYTWQNPGVDFGPTSPVIESIIPNLEVEPQWAIDPEYCCP